jgi:hypothetical protein
VLGAVHDVLPLAATSVSLRSDTRTFTVETDPRGAFTFEGVPAGSYTLTARLSPQFEPPTPVTMTLEGPSACLVRTIRVFRRPTSK